MQLRWKSIFIICLFTAISSCTSIRFSSSGVIETPLQGQLSRSDKVNIKKDIDHYLFGLYPKEYVVDVSEILTDHGYFQVGELTQSYYQNPVQLFIAIITLGMYTPTTLEITGVGSFKRDKFGEKI